VVGPERPRGFNFPRRDHAFQLSAAESFNFWRRIAPLDPTPSSLPRLVSLFDSRHVHREVGLLKLLAGGHRVRHLLRNDAQVSSAGLGLDGTRPPHVLQLPLVAGKDNFPDVPEVLSQAVLFG
jgi:hypothetical protein